MYPVLEFAPGGSSYSKLKQQLKGRFTEHNRYLHHSTRVRTMPYAQQGHHASRSKPREHTSELPL